MFRTLDGTYHQRKCTNLHFEIGFQKATSVDDIPVKICIRTISEPLSKLINFSLVSSSFPKRLKIDMHMTVNCQCVLLAVGPNYIQFVYMCIFMYLIYVIYLGIFFTYLLTCVSGILLCDKFR